MDEVLLKKASSIEKCVNRIREDYLFVEKNLEKNIMAQDAIILNLQRACQLCIDGASRIVKNKKLGYVSSAADGFKLLFEKCLLSEDLLNKMISMVGFRNLSIQEYDEIELEVLNGIIQHHLNDFLDFSKILIREATQ